MIIGDSIECSGQKSMSCDIHGVNGAQTLGTLATENGTFHMIHQKKTNALYVDGHAITAGPADLVESNIQIVRNINGVALQLK